MNELNLAYLLAIFQAAVTANENGSYAIAQADAPELAALVKAKYVKTSKKLHNADGNVGVTLVEGATEADLRIDFEIPDYPAAPQVPELATEAEAAQVAQPELNAAPVAQEEAPAAPVFEPAAEAEDEVITAPFGTVNPDAAQQPTHEQTVPEFQAMTQTAATPVELQQTENTTAQVAGTPEALGGAPIVEQDGVKVIGDESFDVAAVVQTRKGDVEIDVGVPFVAKVSKAAEKKKNAGLEHHPFNDIAQFKIQNPASLPSFHIADRAVKDMSNSVRRANERYEAEGSPVTFRAAPADETDPKGKGVRVFAMFTHEAPAQRRANRKKDDESAEQASE